MNTPNDLDFASRLQTGNNDCGTAVLLMLLDAHGMPSVERRELLEVAGADETGVSLSGLRTAAEHCGFAARAAESAAKHLSDLPVPFVALMNAEQCGTGHYVVVLRLERSTIVVFDPARGIRYLCKTNFNTAWSGKLLLLRPRDERFRYTLDAGRFSASRYLRRALSACFGEALLLAVWSLLTVLLTVAGFLILRRAVLSLSLHNDVAFCWAAVGLLLAAAARTAMHAGQQRLLGRVKRKVGRLARDWCVASLRSPRQFTLDRRQSKTVLAVIAAIKQSAGTAAALFACACDGVQIIFLAIAISIISPILAAALSGLGLVWWLVAKGQSAVRGRHRHQVGTARSMLTQYLPQPAGVSSEVNQQRQIIGRRFLADANLLPLMSAGGAITVLCWAAGSGARATDLPSLFLILMMMNQMCGPLVKVASLGTRIQQALDATLRFLQAVREAQVLVLQKNTAP